MSSAGLLEFLVVELVAAEAGDSHVSRLVCQVLVTQFTRTLSDDSVVEGLRLVELFSVLSSILISVGVLLGGPARAIPESRVHHVSRAIIEECLSWSIQICLVCHVLLELDGILFGELFGWITVLEYGRWLHLWINITSSESRLIWRILRVIMWMSKGHRFRAVSPGRRVQRLIGLWNPLGIEPE